MKVLAFSDIHGDMGALKKIGKKAKKADVLVCAGDISVFEHGLEQIIKELDRIGKPVMLIHGNHEFDETVEKLCKKTKNVKFIHGKHQKIKNVLFLGYGGGGFSFEDPEFEEIGEKFKKVIKDHSVIFIIHGPPYNTKVDEIIDDHVGNLTMREFIDESKPDIVICGHLHENFGNYDVVGESYIVNPGPKGKLLEL